MLAPPTSLALLLTTGLHPSLPLVHALLPPFFRFCFLNPFGGSEEEEDEIGNEKAREAEDGMEALWPVTGWGCRMKGKIWVCENWLNGNWWTKNKKSTSKSHGFTSLIFEFQHESLSRSRSMTSWRKVLNDTMGLMSERLSPILEHPSSLSFFLRPCLCKPQLQGEISIIWLYLPCQLFRPPLCYW